MTESLKPYPEYNDSGLPWLPKIPSSWSVCRNGRLFAERNQTGFGELPILEVSLKTGVRVRDMDSAQRKQVMADREKYKVARAGDIAYNMMRMWQGAVGVAPVDGLVSPAYVVARPMDGVVSEYFAHLFRTAAYMAQVSLYSRGIVADRNRLYWEEFKQIGAPCPPPYEQALIVRFLANVDGLLGRYGQAKRRLIALLESQKRVLIEHTMRGDAPNDHRAARSDRSADSRPERWQEMSLGRCLCEIDQGWSPNASEGAIDEDQWAVLSLSAINRGTFRPDAIKPIPRSAQIPSGIELADGDLILTRSNTRERVGDACIVAGVRPRTILSDLTYRLRLDARSVVPAFVLYHLLSPRGRFQIETSARGSSETMPKIAQQHIRSWRIAVPPLEEQQAIVRQLQVKLTRIDNALSSARYQLLLVGELRTRLTADVVTGELDVRDAAAHLPLEPQADAVGDIEELLNDEIDPLGAPLDDAVATSTE